MSMTFTKLFTSITESSVWVADDHTRLMWITMLAMADKYGRVFGSIPGLANRARVPLEGAEKAIKAFLSPDPYSRTKDHEGKRIEEIDGGWRLLNHSKYRQMRDDEHRREQNRIYKQRSRKKSAESANVSHGQPTGQPIAESDTDTEAYTKSDPLEVSRLRDDKTVNAVRVYEAYPKKAGKPKALQSIQKAIGEFGFDFVMQKTVAYAEARKFEDPQFTPMPATWFNQQRFNDDASTWKNSKPAQPKPESKQIQENIPPKML